MKKNLVLILILCSSWCFVPGTPIQAGELAKENEFPYLAYVTNDLKINLGKCGGAIIHERFVLTACHCVHGLPPERIMIMPGLTELQFILELLYRVKNFMCHPGLIEGKVPIGADIHHDIAVMRTTKNIDTGLNVQIFPLTDGFSEIENKVGVVAGWGEVRPGAKLSKQLRKVRLTIGVEETCARYFVDDNYICVVHPLRGTGSGDSGGPLVVDNAIVGIVTHDRLAGGMVVSKFARITFYRKWIEETIKNLICTEQTTSTTESGRHAE